MEAAPSGSSAAQLLRRLGLAGGGHDRQLAWRILVGLLLLYSVSFAAFYPRIATNDDEAMYLRQVQLVLRGEATIEQTNPLDGTRLRVYPSTYVPGTAMLIAPLAKAGGIGAAWLFPWLCLVLAAVLTARWIEEEGHSPLFAVVLLGFPPALVMGRVVMSGVPSTAIAALGMWLFWVGQGRGPGWWLGSGFVAGASFAIRASNPVLFVPLFAGTLLRREWRCWALIVGGLIGLSVRFLAMQLYFGDWAFERSEYHLALSTIGDRLPLLAAGLLVFVPGGLLFGLLYKGRRRPEIIATVVLFACFYLFQTYSTFATGFLKRVVLALRYYIPLLPVLAFAMAGAFPRLWDAWMARTSSELVRGRLSAALAALTLVWLIGIAAASTAVHPFFSQWSSTQADIRDAMAEQVPDDAVLVTNWMATRKFVNVLGRRFRSLERNKTHTDAVLKMASRYGGVYIAQLERTDSAHWLADRDRARDFVRRLGDAAELRFDQEMSGTDRLRVWYVTSEPRAASAGSADESQR